MSYREIEDLRGVGTILKEDGSVFGERQYHLRVLQRMLDDGRGGTIPGLLHVEGRIALQDMEGLTLLIDNNPLTLRLEDGRRLPFFFSHSNGTIAARGKLE